MGWPCGILAPCHSWPRLSLACSASRAWRGGGTNERKTRITAVLFELVRQRGTRFVMLKWEMNRPDSERGERILCGWFECIRAWFGRVSLGLCYIEGTL